MAEPQIPGVFSGAPAEGNPAEVIPGARPLWTEGPTPDLQPSYSAIGNPSVNPEIPRQRDYRQSGEWRW